MKEKPIIFNTENIKSILDGRKTQTRRVIKQNPDIFSGDVDLFKGFTIRRCPYGQVGDRLWVRETWATLSEYDNEKPSEICADVWYPASADFCVPTWVGRLRPSIFMPRWASRITLEITEVRVERVQEITVEDCKAEGVTFSGTLIIEPDFMLIDHFAILWDSLNAKRGYGWVENPFVWVIEFRRATDVS